MKKLYLPILAAALFPLAAVELKIEESGITASSSRPAAAWKKAALVPYMTIGPKGKARKLVFRGGRAETPEMAWRVSSQKRGELTEISSVIENRTETLGMKGE